MIMAWCPLQEHEILQMPKISFDKTMFFHIPLSYSFKKCIVMNISYFWHLEILTEPH